MSEQMFLVFAALARGPRYGYAILAEIAEAAAGLSHLRVGTLYGILDRAVKDGLIEVDREEVVNRRLRRYYRLTDSGQRSLHAETARRAEVSTIAAALQSPGNTTTSQATT